MLHILLLILKIIGMILGILVGVILAILCLALFVPVRYRIEAERTEGEGNPPVDAIARFTWLLHLINVRVVYSEELKLRARILFFTLSGTQSKAGKTEKEKPAKRKEKSEKNRDGESNSADENKETQTESAVNDKSDDDYFGQQGDDEGEDEQKLSLKEKIIKICRFFKNIWYTIKGIYDKIKEIFENIEYYLDIIKGDTFKAAFALCKDELGSVFSYIKPRKLDARLVIGTGDPASTAQILSYYYGILYPLIGNHVIIEGDFDDKRIEGSVYIKGKMRLFTFLKAAVRIYFNKDIKKLLKLFKKEDE